LSQSKLPPAKLRPSTSIPRTKAPNNSSPEPKLEGHATEDQPEQHQDHRYVEGRHQDRVCERKGGKKAPAAQHEPGFVSVPEGRDGVHHAIPAFVRGGKGKEDAQAEIEPIEQNVEEQSRADQAVPDEGKIQKTLEAKHPGLLPLTPDA
jgi:hypothetical protein